jgi:hypothetical protein
MEREMQSTKRLQAVLPLMVCFGFMMTSFGCSTERDFETDVESAPLESVPSVAPTPIAPDSAQDG